VLFDPSQNPQPDERLLKQQSRTKAQRSRKNYMFAGWID
jgi:hypothetical protein